MRGPATGPGVRRRVSAVSRPGARILALALILAVPACSSSLGSEVIGNRRRVLVRTPGQGEANIALVRFHLKAGQPIPHLRIANAYRQSKTAAFVGGIARVGKHGDRYMGLVAVIDFRAGAAPSPQAGAADIVANHPFFIDYLGDMGSIGSQGSNIQALLVGIPGPQAWTVDWFNQPEVTSKAAQAFVRDGRSLLDAMFRRLAGRPSPGFVRAILGEIPSTGSPPVASGPSSPAARPSTGGSKAGGGGSGGAGSGSSGAPGAGLSPGGGSQTGSPGDGGDSSPGSTTLANTVLSASVPGPAAVGAKVSATTTCPAGKTLTGGGFHLHTTTGATPNNSLRALGGFPSSTDGSPVGSGGTRSWTAIGGAGGQPMTDAVTAAVVLCAVNGPPATEVVVVTAPGPTAASTTTSVIARCPPGTVLVGGGANTVIPPDPPQPSLHLIGSFPSDAAGNPAASGTSVTAWTATAAAGGAQISNATTTAFVVCGRGGPATRVVSVDVGGPETPSTPVSVTAGCPAGTVLLGGGVNAHLNGGTPQHGVHLTGSFPSSGDAPAASGTSASAWTTVVQSGGQPAPGTQSTAFAICG